MCALAKTEFKSILNDFVFLFFLLVTYSIVCLHFCISSKTTEFWGHVIPTNPFEWKKKKKQIITGKLNIYGEEFPKLNRKQNSKGKKRSLSFIRLREIIFNPFASKMEIFEVRRQLFNRRKKRERETKNHIDDTTTKR